MSEASPVGTQAAHASTTGIVVCADDFAMTNGVSQAIIDLAEAGRLSAVSAMTTTAHWPSHATWLARVRGKVSAGLHLNLTLGAPLGAMPTFAPGRTFPTLGGVTGRALLRRIDPAELSAEIDRQIAAFEAEIGFPPDHIDGHQHVHALPQVRACLLGVLVQRYAKSALRPLLRAPAEPPSRILARGSAVMKSLVLSGLSSGFAGAAATAGFPCNDGFGGVTAFRAGTVDAEFAQSCAAPGPRHLVMCHPGLIDDELRRIDPILERREDEFRMLAAGRFPAAIWRPHRSASGPPIDWATDWTGTS